MGAAVAGLMLTAALAAAQSEEVPQSAGDGPAGLAAPPASYQSAPTPAQFSRRSSRTSGRASFRTWGRSGRFSDPHGVLCYPPYNGGWTTTYFDHPVPSWQFFQQPQVIVMPPRAYSWDPWAWGGYVTPAPVYGYSWYAPRARRGGW
jgi:hypothetical protein